jgi:hypothetical protein
VADALSRAILRAPNALSCLLGPCLARSLVYVVVADDDLRFVGRANEASDRDIDSAHRMEVTRC